jgi:hypothetical protein
LILGVADTLYQKSIWKYTSSVGALELGGVVSTKNSVLQILSSAIFLPRKFDSKNPVSLVQRLSYLNSAKQYGKMTY